MRVLAVIVSLYEKVSGFSGYLRPEVVAVDRSVRMRVAGVRSEAEDVVSLRLEPLDERLLPGWSPGAHIDVELVDGRIRQYSLCGDPAERGHYRIAVRRIADGDGGSLAMHRLAPGDGITVRGPRHAFPFVEARSYLFVAGGIGITPILPMVVAAARRGADWNLVYTGRTRAAMPFLSELAALDPGRVRLRPDDEFGRPDAPAIAALAAPGSSLYACGPPPMIESLRAALPVGSGVALHYERFSAAPVVEGEPFEVVLAHSGRVVGVGAHETALTAVRRVLPDVAYSCRQGFCGTCQVGLIGGEVQHRDRCLTEPERATRFALCVSRAHGRVTLEL